MRFDYTKVPWSIFCINISECSDSFAHNRAGEYMTIIAIVVSICTIIAGGL
jgi:hypothetical protein